MLALWLSDLGGSLHGPVVTYFYLRLGSTPMQIGILGFGMRGSTMLLSPAYGRLVDRFGIARPMLGCVLCCGCGCLLRGAAQAVWQLFAAQVLMGMGGGSQWSMVKGYVAPELDDCQRSLLVVGLRVQMTVLTLTSLLYPALDGMFLAFGLAEPLQRYRAVIGACAAFCWAGIGILLCGEGGARHVDTRVVKAVPAWKAEAGPSFAVGKCSSGFRLSVLVLGMVMCGRTMCYTLWPIFIAQRFRWEARAYAYLSFAHSLLSTAGLAMYPRAVQNHADPRWALQALAVGSLFALLGFFAQTDDQQGWPPAMAHVLLALPCLVAMGVLCSGVEAAASLFVPAAEQGWAMGSLNAAVACGALVGSLLGPALWTWSLRLGPDASWALAGGGLPFTVTGCMLLASLILLRLDSMEDATGASHSSTSDVAPDSLGAREGGDEEVEMEALNLPAPIGATP